MNKKIIIPLLIISLTSCSKVNHLSSKVFCFETLIDINLYEGKEDNLLDIKNEFLKLNNLTDNYHEISDVNGIYKINQTNEEISVDNELYDLLKTAYSLKDKGASNFNILCGSLSKKWKESLEKKEILSQSVIDEELTKISSTSLLFKENNIVQRVGEAEIDLGAIAKGYALDKAKEYLVKNKISHYLINAGNSSILLGEKQSDEGLFNVGINDIPNAYFKAKNVFISTSGISEQGVEINGVTYSHIVNPNTGSVINENDSVIVITNSGYFSDAMSTSLMMNTVDEIKELEKEYNFKTIVIKDEKIIYSNKDIEVLKH